jgi:hypothetical protein
MPEVQLQRNESRQHLGLQAGDLERSLYDPAPQVQESTNPKTKRFDKRRELNKKGSQKPPLLL